MPDHDDSSARTPQDAESIRLAEDDARRSNWKRWGPYLAERQWGTVREDYSTDGNCWEYFSHDHARSRVYRWGEDGLLGICDRQCRLCFGIALWNEQDHILKERLFGLTNSEGNHGEDVKECYYYLDSTPTHSYMKALYKYPQRAFPYQQLIEENRQRGKTDPECELTDTGIFNDHRYFDVFVEYAKHAEEDILIRITVANRGPAAARLHLLPTVWFRNTWSWGRESEGYQSNDRKPQLRRGDDGMIHAEHATLGRFRFASDVASDGSQPQWLFTENETNIARLFGSQNVVPHVKDAFHDYVIHQRNDAVNPHGVGTKAAAHYVLNVPPGGSVTVNLRLTSETNLPNANFGRAFDEVLAARRADADAFYASRIPATVAPEARNVMRQAYAGLLWSKQFYHYVVQQWMEGDPSQPPPPHTRMAGRNSDWHHLYNRDVISMPDKWEYPWYAAWDLAFHMIPFAQIDPQFAKDQLLLMLREWYMHPNGQIPAYEFNFSDVNPPVHAWACWRVYKMTGRRGQRDRVFLARVFQKLLINFTWWVNRKDLEGKHLFAGGFLGLDNIGVFDRSRPLPTGGHLDQADGTAWMAFYCLTMLAMALELAGEDPSYEDVASKFFEHFVAIADAMNALGGTGLWDEQDGFYYDQLHVDGTVMPLRVRSLVGLMPLIAVVVLEEDVIKKLPGFRKRMQWFLENRKDLARHISYYETLSSERRDPHAHHLLAIPSRARLESVLRYMLDETEFLSAYGIRSVSRFHHQQPYVHHANGSEFRVDYVPGESTTGLFGGNSNWRGPIWFPVNYLLIEALERYDYFYRDSLTVECPIGSGTFLRLQDVADRLRQRLSAIFLPASHGRPCHGNDTHYTTDPHWKDLVLFYEYFHGENGRGIGANHQTGWTALVTRCIEDAVPGIDAAADIESREVKPDVSPRSSKRNRTPRAR